MTHDTWMTHFATFGDISEVKVSLVSLDHGSTEVNSVLKLIRVRNPHASGEWTGRFSDSDAETWNAYPEALAATGHRIGMKDCWGATAWESKSVAPGFLRSLIFSQYVYDIT